MRGVLDERDRLAAALLTAERKAESLTTEVSLLQERLEVAKTELYTELSEKRTPQEGEAMARQAAELELLRATVEELTASMKASQGKADAAAVTIAVLEARLAGSSSGEAAAFAADGEEAAKVESLQETLKAVCERLDEMGKQRDVLRDEAATRAAKWGAAAMAASTAAALETSDTAEDAEEDGARAFPSAGSTEALVRQMREAEEVGAGLKRRLEFAQEQVDAAAARHQRLAAMMHSSDGGGGGGGDGGTDPADIMGLAKQVRRTHTLICWC
jgi:hypothetical protein